jgi:hypothetical protein
MQNEPLASILGQVFEFLPGRKPTNGGSIETETNDPMTMASGSSPAMPVTRVTPVG